MTPLQIEMLLHFHTTPTPWPRLNAPACVEAIEGFIRDGLVRDDDPSRYWLTERGEACIRFLCAMPIPVANWAIPGPWAPSHPTEE
ncbi:hypothetical protein J7E70_07930 [Variovorax paradoxus]|nr:hypothetical protein [Variovorax paradoxus]MBT2300392.1 hypothetical protein [Variovorax paradoxus]